MCSIKIYGKWLQTSKQANKHAHTHTHVQCSLTSVGLIQYCSKYANHHFYFSGFQWQFQTQASTAVSKLPGYPGSSEIANGGFSAGSLHRWEVFNYQLEIQNLSANSSTE